MGRSGAGKSSLIRTINRLEQPTSGRVLIDQVDIGEFDEDRLVELRRRILLRVLDIAFSAGAASESVHFAASADRGPLIEQAVTDAVARLHRECTAEEREGAGDGPPGRESHGGAGRVREERGRPQYGQPPRRAGKISRKTALAGAGALVLVGRCYDLTETPTKLIVVGSGVTIVDSAETTEERMAMGWALGGNAWNIRLRSSCSRVCRLTLFVNADSCSWVGSSP